MYHYRDFDSVTEANESFQRLRELEKSGEVRMVNLSERSDGYLRLFRDEKRYIVSWHSWSD